MSPHCTIDAVCISGNGVGTRLHESIWSSFGVPRVRSERMQRPRRTLGIIATPPFTHAEQVRMTARDVGLILCEKPCGATLANCVSIKNEITDEKVPLIVNYQLRFNDRLIDTIYENIKGSELNRIKYRSSAYRNAGNPHWMNYIRCGGSAIYAVGSHIIDILGYIYGDINVVRCDMLENAKLKCEIDVCGKFVEIDIALDENHAEFQIVSGQQCVRLIEEGDCLRTRYDGIWRDSYRMFVTQYISDSDGAMQKAAKIEDALRVHRIVSLIVSAHGRRMPETE